MRSMNERHGGSMFVLLVVLGMGYPAMAQDATPHYTKMAPIEQYLMADRTAEIALARSAAISAGRDGNASRVF